MKCCCVIGGTGFVGSFLVRALLKEGRKVIVVGRNKLPSRPLPDNVEYTPGNFGDKYFLQGILRGVDEIIDLAYATVPKTSYDDPVRDIVNNLPSAVRLFEVASELSIKKLIMISSGGTVYGIAQNLPITEYHPTNPISPYGITKLAIEKYAMMYHHSKKLPVICVRPSNAFGEGQKPFTGQGFIATAIAHILKQQEIILYGETGTIRDYIHINDVTRGIIAALDYGIPGSCYNIGTGIGKSNKEVLDDILPLAMSAGLKPRIQVMPTRQFDVPANVLDSSKMREETGWMPLIPFGDGIKKTWNWYYNEMYDYSAQVI